ncbi:TDP-N-acetylfucosamine:lipid II N-acetylfucosaminyltransferase [compost metagenome]
MKLDKIITDDVGFVNFSYYPIEYIGMKNELNVFEKPNILIGNSATSTNNHLDVFKILLKYNLSGKKLIVPLSYGDEKYKSLIVSAGYKYFGSTFDPVLDFMPLDQYNNKLSTCGIAIMNHYRQQAIGNIISLLSQGCKVYLSKFATSYPYFKRLGFFIYSVEDDLLTASFNNLKQEEALQNKLIVKHYFGEKNLIDNLVF